MVESRGGDRANRARRVVALVLSLLLITSFARATEAVAPSPPPARYQIVTGGPGADSIWSIDRTPGGGHLVSAEWAGEGGGSGIETLPWLLRFDASGRIVWQRLLDGATASGKWLARTTADGGVIWVGGAFTPQPPNQRLSHVYVLRLDSAGNIVSQRSLTDDSGFVVYAVGTLGVTHDGGALIAVSDTARPEAYRPIDYYRIDVEGRIRWKTTLWNRNGAPTAIEAPNGDIRVASNPDTGGEWPVALELESFDTTGHVVAETSYFPSAGWNVAAGLAPVPDGGFILSATLEQLNLPPAGWLAKVDALGAVEWSRTYSASKPQYFGGVAVADDGAVVAAATTHAVGPGDDSFYVVSNTADGQPRWESTFGGPGPDRAADVSADADGAVLVGGATASFGSAVTGQPTFPYTTFDAYLVKVAADGTTCPGPSCRLTWIALGDGYSSGEGTGSYLRASNSKSNQCHRSTLAYSSPSYGIPVVPINGVALDRQLYACSGATVDNVVSGGAGLFHEPAQLDRPGVDASASLATITVGREDVAYSWALDACASLPSCDTWKPVTGSSQTLRDVLLARVANELPARLDRALTQLRLRMPGATAIALGYPQSFPSTSSAAGCPALAPYFSPEEQRMLREVLARVNDAIEAAAARAGVAFVPAAERFAGHEACGPAGAWLTAWNPKKRAESFQTTKRGQTEYANLLNQFIRAAVYASDAETLPSGLPANPLTASGLPPGL